MKTRRSFIVLVAINIALSVIMLFAALHAQTNNNQKFCELVAISNLHPVPVEPSSDVSSIKNRAWAMYSAYSKFGHDLGCPIS